MFTQEQISDYFEKQKSNIPNEAYINSSDNINKADFYRMEYIYNDNNTLVGKMLDIGCNDGYFMRNFNWNFDKFTGIDMFSISDYMNISIDKYNYHKDIKYYSKNGKISFICNMFETYNFSGEKFDFIFAGEIIEHVICVDDFLKHIIKLMNKESVLCITTPNNIGGNHAEHYRQFDNIELYIALSKYFNSVKITELPQINNSWPFLYARCTDIKI